MTARLAEYHLGHVRATSTSVAKGPNLEAAIDQSESPSLTTTAASAGRVVERIDWRLSSPGSGTGVLGCHPGSLDREAWMSSENGGVELTRFKEPGFHAACPGAMLWGDALCQPGSGDTISAWATPTPRT